MAGWDIFASRVTTLLAEQNITQRELADKIGRSEAAVSRWLSRKRIPDANDVRDVAKALHCSCDYLCGLSKEVSRA